MWRGLSGIGIFCEYISVCRVLPAMSAEMHRSTLLGSSVAASTPCTGASVRPDATSPPGASQLSRHVFLPLGRFTLRYSARHLADFDAWPRMTSFEHVDLTSHLIGAVGRTSA